MLKNLKFFWRANKPVIMRQKKLDMLVLLAIHNALKVADKFRWSALNPVIYDLEALRANTWDQDRITKIQQWLKDNFQPVKEDKKP